MSDREVSKPAQPHDVTDAATIAPDEDPQHLRAGDSGPLSGDERDVVPASSTTEKAPTDAEVRDAADVLAAAGERQASTGASFDTEAGAAAAPQRPGNESVAHSANETLAEAARAADGATGAHTAKPAGAQAAGTDPDLAAFEEAEAAYPGTFGGTFTPPSEHSAADSAMASSRDAHDASTTRGSVATKTADPETEKSERPAEAAEAEIARTQTGRAKTAPVESEDDAKTEVYAPPAPTSAESSGIEAGSPIFVQAPEPPRQRSNRGAIFGIGLLASVSFAVLYLGTALGIAALNGKANASNAGTYLLEQQLGKPGLWITVVVFAIGFWLLGGIINRGRWGFWVIFGIIVGGFAYGGHLLGAIGSAQFWRLSTAQVGEIVNGQLLAPLAIAAFVFGRELTIWFGAWAARTGARRTVQNEQAQREYERVLEAGPQLP